MDAPHVTPNGFTNLAQEFIVLVDLGEGTLQQSHNHAVHLLFEALEIYLVHRACNFTHKLVSEQLGHFSIFVEGHVRDIERVLGDNLSNP